MMMAAPISSPLADMMPPAPRPCYALVAGIGRTARSADLRRHFAEFAEAGRLDCFHYRHRPEGRRRPAEVATGADGDAAGASGEEEAAAAATTSDTAPAPAAKPKKKKKKAGRPRCCLVRLPSAAERAAFIKRYHGARWEEFESARCLVAAVKEPEFDDSPTSPWQLELRPPADLPQGNVGTPTAWLLARIADCRLPARLIKQLGVNEAGRRRRRRKYGEVHMEYGGDRPFAARGGAHSPVAGTSGDHGPAAKNGDTGGGDDEDAEEWERAECMLKDADKSQYSNQVDKLFEEEMEVTWEKGGPGLVYYTDSFFWDQQKGTDCDERWHDLWDVDTNVYYDPQGNACDRDMRDMLEINKPAAARDRESVFAKTRPAGGQQQHAGGAKRRPGRNEAADWSVGAFERHTKGVGAKLMSRMGWRPGGGLGPELGGQPEPPAVWVEGVNEAREAVRDQARRLTSEQIRPGLGYTGPLMQRFVRPRAQPKRRISTVYDEPAETDPPVHWTRSDEGFSLKHFRRGSAAGGDAR